MKTKIRCVQNTFTEYFHLERKVWWGWTRKVVKYRGVWQKIDKQNTEIACWSYYHDIKSTKMNVVSQKEF